MKPCAAAGIYALRRYRRNFLSVRRRSTLKLMDEQASASTGQMQNASRMVADPQHVPPLLCFSHLRWNFVYQRPQHLMTRAARDRRVVFWEEPVRAQIGEDAPRLALSVVEGGVRVVTPVLPPHFSEQESVA